MFVLSFNTALFGLVSTQNTRASREVAPDLLIQLKGTSEIEGMSKGFAGLIDHFDSVLLRALKLFFISPLAFIKILLFLSIAGIACFLSSHTIHIQSSN
jgi:hypothetical protein